MWNFLWFLWLFVADPVSNSILQCVKSPFKNYLLKGANQACQKHGAFKPPMK